MYDRISLYLYLMCCTKFCVRDFNLLPETVPDTYIEDYIAAMDVRLFKIVWGRYLLCSLDLLEKVPFLPFLMMDVKMPCSLKDALDSMCEKEIALVGVD